MRRLGKGAGRDGIRRIGPAPRPDPPFPVASRPLGRRPGVHGCPGGPEAPPVTRCCVIYSLHRKSARKRLEPIPRPMAPDKTLGVFGHAELSARGPRHRFQPILMILRGSKILEKCCPRCWLMVNRSPQP